MPGKLHNLYSTGCNKARRIIKDINIEKEEINFSLFTENMIVYLKNLK
jgi:hypothetical protein